MNINKNLIIIGIIGIILVIFIPTTYKVFKNHQIHLIQVTESKIIEAAKKCYFEEKCIDEKITLKDLYTLNYLDKINNPISKEYYNEESYIEVKDNTFKFVVKE